MKLRHLVILAVVLIFGLWYTNLQLRFRRVFQELSVDWPSTINVRPFDERSELFRDASRTNWVIRYDETNGTFARLIEAQGLAPSVQKLTNMLTTPTPAYSWWNQSRNRKTIVLGTVKEIVCSMGTVSEDVTESTLRVSEDGHVALLWCGENNVILFQDEPSGLVHRPYWRSD